MTDTGPAFVAGIGLGLTVSSGAVAVGAPAQTIAVTGTVALLAAFMYGEMKAGESR